MTEVTRLPQLGTTATWITDPSGNVVNLHGVNLVSKTNKTPEQLGFDARNAEFLAKHGFSVVRLGVGWCNVQPMRPGPPPVVYDDNYLASLARTIELLAQFGIYTLVDFHQDAYGAPWGYGAPGWAVVPAGPRNRPTVFPFVLWAEIDSKSRRLSMGSRRTVTTPWMRSGATKPSLECRSGTITCACSSTWWGI